MFTPACIAFQMVFHSPYHKLVQQSFARTAYLDMLRAKSEVRFTQTRATHIIHQTIPSAPALPATSFLFPPRRFC